MKNTLLLIQLLTSLTLSAQPTLQWQTTYGGSDSDEAKGICATADGGYVTLGITYSDDGDVSGHHGFSDFWLVKLNELGEIQWQKTLGGSFHDWPYDIKTTSDGGFIAVGYTNSNDGDVTGLHGDKDAWIIKLSPSGSLEWQKTIGGTNWDEAWSVNHSHDGGYIICGRSNSIDGDAAGNPGNSLDCWVVKLDQSGEIQWQNTYGGMGEETATSIRQTADNGFVFTAETKSTDGDVSFNNGNFDVWIVKLDSVGVLVWEHTLGGSGWDVGKGILETTGGYLAWGYTGSNDGDITNHHGLFDCWVIKLDSVGNLIWQRTLGGTNTDRLHSGIATLDGEFVFSGTVRSNNGDVLGNHGNDDFWVLKLSSDGELRWQKCFGGTKGESCFALMPATDGGFLVAGYAWSDNGDLAGISINGQSDLWIVKLAPETTSPTQQPEPPALSLSPNPAHQTTSLHVPGEYDLLQVEITDLLGRLMSVQQIRNGENIHLQALAPGAYFVMAMAVDGRRFVGKLLKE